MINNRKVALVTGATSGIGMEFARQLYADGFYMVLTGRNEDILSKLQTEFGEDMCTTITANLCKTSECIRLYKETKKFDVDVFINNAGFGLFGGFTDTKLSTELEMIDLNIKAMHTLFKLYLRDMVKKDSGYILNVGSTAGMLPGPMMSTYYSSKSYVIRQTQAVREELRQRKSRVVVSVLCPGPVSTEFNNRAGVSKFAIKSISPEYCVAYTIEMMKRRRLMIIPTPTMKLLAIGTKLAPNFILAPIAYHIAG